MVECLVAATADCIKWPTAPERRALVGAMAEFVEGRGPAPIGIVDGTAQYVRRPGPDEALYYNGRKKRHFVNHLVVCDWRGCIIAVRAGFTGKTHDGVAYRSTDLYERRGQFFHQGQTLLADCGFRGCQLITPILARQDRALTGEELAFNRVVRRYRVVVEFVFGALKNKFRILSNVWRFSLERAPVVFALCCQLFNFYMAKSGKYVRDRNFQAGRVLADWEAGLLRRVGGDWANTEREQVRRFFASAEGHALFDNW